MDNTTFAARHQNVYLNVCPALKYVITDLV